MVPRNQCFGGPGMRSMAAYLYRGNTNTCVLQDRARLKHERGQQLAQPNTIIVTTTRASPTPVNTLIPRTRSTTASSSSRATNAMEPSILSRSCNKQTNKQRGGGRRNGKVVGKEKESKKPRWNFMGISLCATLVLLLLSHRSHHRSHHIIPHIIALCVLLAASFSLTGIASIASSMDLTQLQQVQHKHAASSPTGSQKHTGKKRKHVLTTSASSTTSSTTSSTPSLSPPSKLVRKHASNSVTVVGAQ
jgi:hypothetical protein